MTLVLPVPQISRLPLLGREREVEAAYDAWGANCGPLAIAAATDRSLDAVRTALRRSVRPAHARCGASLLGDHHRVRDGSDATERPA